MFVTTLVLSLLLAVFFLASGIPKVAGARLMQETAEHFNLPEIHVRGIGLLEVAGSAGLAGGLPLAPLGVAAGAGLGLLMTGAVMFHVRAGDPAARIAAPAIVGMLAVATVCFRVLSA